MGSLINEYYDIMLRYKCGEFGDELLSLKEILEMANRPNLLNEMSIRDLKTLKEGFYGYTKSLFATLIKQKMK